jgi:hypothetical protein
MPPRPAARLGQARRPDRPELHALDEVHLHHAGDSAPAICKTAVIADDCSQ